MVTPGPPRYPLYADDTTDSVEAHVDPRRGRRPLRRTPTSYLDDQDLDDDYERRMVPAWLPWVLVALMLLLVAVGGIWLLLSPDDDSATESPAASVPASQETSDEPAPPSSSAVEEPSSSAPPPSETVPAGDPVDVAALGDRHGADGGAPERGRLRQPHDVRRGQHARRARRHLLADGRRRHRR